MMAKSTSKKTINIDSLAEAALKARAVLGDRVREAMQATKRKKHTANCVNCVKKWQNLKKGDIMAKALRTLAECPRYEDNFAQYFNAKKYHALMITRKYAEMFRLQGVDCRSCSFSTSRGNCRMKKPRKVKTPTCELCGQPMTECRC